MKKILAIFVLVLMGTAAFAQGWGILGTDIHTTVPGNVGIGTGVPFAPTFKLHINTPAAIASLVAQSSVAPADPDRAIGFFRMLNGANNETYNIAFRKAGGVYQCLQSALVAGSTVNISLFDYTAKNLKFGGNGLTDVFFNNSGSVGIGGMTAFGLTGTGALAKLQVNGAIICKELEVRITPWPDHVFKAGYNLRSLYEVESFINENKHLPDVPSEAYVDEHGVNVGQISATLLQKIEELTLYMIDLKKENDILKARVDALQK